MNPGLPQGGPLLLSRSRGWGPGLSTQGSWPPSSGLNQALPPQPPGCPGTASPGEFPETGLTQVLRSDPVGLTDSGWVSMPFPNLLQNNGPFRPLTGKGRSAWRPVAGQ